MPADGRREYPARPESTPARAPRAPHLPPPMTAKHPTRVRCQICGVEKDVDDVLPAELVRDSIVRLIESRHPSWSSEGYICAADLNQFRDRYVAQIVEEEAGEISSLEREVLEAVREHELLAENPNRDFEEGLSLGDRVADHIAAFGGSWWFLSTFALFLVGWIALNSVALSSTHFDPYPYILLNLLLSCLAAIQAPVIMMSQKRLESRDRLRAESDYKVNLKAELEVRLLGERIDRLLRHQWQRLLEIQQVQMDLMADLVRARDAQQRGRS
jgi:uncharacterized membrane protein